MKAPVQTLAIRRQAGATRRTKAASAAIRAVGRVPTPPATTNVSIPAVAGSSAVKDSVPTVMPTELRTAPPDSESRRMR